MTIRATPSPSWRASENFPSELTAGIAGAESSVRLCGLTVHVDLAALAGFLRLGPRLEKARDVEPHVETDAFRRYDPGIIHGVRYA